MVAFIPARGGSKVVPGKNIADIGGKPMIAYTILAALQSPYIKRVVVSSDSEEILAVAREFGAETLLRPSEISQDQSPSSDAILHFINVNNLEAENIEQIVLMQATSPFRNIDHLNEAIQKYNLTKAETLISISEYDVSPFRSYKVQGDGLMSPLFEASQLAKRRQDYERCFAANGAIYIFPWKKFKQVGAIPLENLVGYEMKPPYDLDIDTLIDLEFSRFLLSRNFLGLGH